jgi:signal transduction histidine kinase
MYDLPDNHPAPLPDETQRRGALVLRTLPILLIPIVVALITVVLIRISMGSQFAPPDRPDGPPLGPLVPIVVLVVFFSSLIVLVRLGRPTLSALLLIGVWTLVTTGGVLRAGITSYTPALLVLPICAAGLLIDWVACVSLAALATLLVGSLTWLAQRGLLPPSPAPPPFIAANQSYLALGFWVALFTTVAALTSMLAGGLQRALRQSRGQALALQELSSQLEARVEAQTTQILEQEREAATLAERARLAREIHDTLAQGLTGIVVQLGAAQRALAAASSDAEEHIDLAQRMARESLAEARRSVWNLRAPALERGDLADALRGLVARPLRPGVAVGFEQRGEPWPLAPGVESALLRVGQEALANVAKHADATRADVLLEYAPDLVRLTIHDDGVGFDEATLHPDVSAPGPWGGFGLLGMRERLAALGGTLELRNGEGATVVAAVPRNEELKIEN